MGTALAVLCARQGCMVTIWSIEKDVVKTINQAHHNHKYLPKIELPAAVRATDILSAALKENKFIISALPTQVTGLVFQNNSRYFTAAHRILSVSKGFIKETGETVCARIQNIVPYARVVALMGPLFANEIAEGKPCVALLAGADAKTRSAFVKILRSDLFRIQETSDVLGAEAAGALKNIYAIFMGILAGLFFGWNTKSALITMALQEMAQIVEHLGGRRETVYGLAGVGDLITTGFGEQSRNRRFGEALCATTSVGKALQSVGGQVVEGVKTLEVIDRVIADYDKPLPLLKLIKNLLAKKVDPRSTILKFMKKYV